MKKKDNSNTWPVVGSETYVQTFPPVDSKFAYKIKFSSKINCKNI